MTSEQTVTLAECLRGIILKEAVSYAHAIAAVKAVLASLLVFAETEETQGRILNEIANMANEGRKILPHLSNPTSGD